MKLDLSPPILGGGAASPPVNGRIGEVRRNGWLYSLEHALLENGSRLAQRNSRNNESEVCGPGAAKDAASKRSGSPEASADAQSAQEQATREDAIRGQSIRRNLATRNKALTPGASACESPANEAVEAESRSAHPAKKASSPEAARDGEPVSGRAWLLANGAAAQSVPASPTCIQIFPGLPTDPICAHAMSALVTERAPDLGTESAAASAAYTSAADALAPDAAVSQPPQIPHDPHHVLERGAMALQPAFHQPYGRQQLHVHVSDIGVQAWVRDADLSPAGAFRVASAFLQNAQYGGARLAALSINGKKVIDTTFSRHSATDSLTQPGARRSPPGDLEHGN